MEGADAEAKHYYIVGSQRDVGTLRALLNSRFGKGGFTLRSRKSKEADSVQVTVWKLDPPPEPEPDIAEPPTGGGSRFSAS